MITSKWIIVSLLEAIDQFIMARLVNIALIKDLNSLDKEPLVFICRNIFFSGFESFNKKKTNKKDSLKHFSKLIHEYNIIVASPIIINQISPFVKFTEWSHQRISNLLGSGLALF